MASETLKNLQWRYATKKFDSSKELSEEKISILKETFKLTATSFGLQPLKLLVISNPELKKQLVPATYHQAQVQDASHVLVLCLEKKIGPSFIKDHFSRVEAIRNTARDILTPFEDELLNYFEGKSATEIEAWMINQLYLTLGALLTVCATEKIDSCPIEGFEPEKYNEILKLDDLGLKSVVVLAVGYRDNEDFFGKLKKVRRGIEELIIEFE